MGQRHCSASGRCAPGSACLTLCLPKAACSVLFDLKGRCSARSVSKNGASGSQAKGHSLSYSSCCLHADLPEVLQAFRAKGEAAVLATSGGDGGPLWAAACDLVEALLLGVRSHLQDVRTECELRLANEEPCSVDTDVVSLKVRFSAAPLIGEVATPSRFCHEVHLLEEVGFALRRPPTKTARDPLVLRVEGLELAELPEIPGLRRKIKTSLGSDFNIDTAYSWWLQHKDKEYPLDRSKFHRIYESLWGMRTMQMLPKQMSMDFFWSFLHGTNCHLEAFMFHHGKCSSRVRIAAQRGPGRNTEERELLAFSAPLAKQALAANRSNGERFAASVTNFGAMVYGRDIGQPPASARVITKIFSAARWWGHGPNGWQRFDHTWLCRDQTNSLGIVVKEQGRIIWRLPGESDSMRPPLEVRPPRRICCCRRRRSEGAS
uniref:Uncharacterized protein n=1 Tax=Pyrodinium bahamense TaxID=73915 RepID=A0A7S0FXV1_9DINO|mmetsp:Transcript_8944/g.24832  ORF Transcript_8944/g.24832 Transcript_8944/m.24832 type:complete len:433 (+) Transcript_8944:63-1361(+)